MLAKAKVTWRLKFEISNIFWEGSSIKRIKASLYRERQLDFKFKSWVTLQWKQIAHGKISSLRIVNQIEWSYSKK